MRTAPAGAFALSLLATLLAGCGYIQSGTWDDDPDNWRRAFRSSRPDDVVVVHSHYWRAPHWSYEAGYLFEIRPNDGLRTQLFGQNRLRKIQDPERDPDARPCSAECPDWFAPKPLAEYDVWAYEDDSTGNFRVLIDRATGHIFLGDFQL